MEADIAAHKSLKTLFFKNIFMALDSKGPGCVNLMSPRVGNLTLVFGFLSLQFLCVSGRILMVFSNEIVNFCCSKLS